MKVECPAEHISIGSRARQIEVTFGSFNFEPQNKYVAVEERQMHTASSDGPVLFASACPRASQHVCQATRETRRFASGRVDTSIDFPEILVV
jgi:hypothetical protein